MHGHTHSTRGRPYACPTLGLAPYYLQYTTVPCLVEIILDLLCNYLVPCVYTLGCSLFTLELILSTKRAPSLVKDSIHLEPRPLSPVHCPQFSLGYSLRPYPAFLLCEPLSVSHPGVTTRYIIGSSRSTRA